MKTPRLIQRKRDGIWEVSYYHNNKRIRKSLRTNHLPTANKIAKELELEVIKNVLVGNKPINAPPTPSELQSLAAKMGIRAKDFIRKNEAVFKELDLKLHMDNDEFLFQKMSENPKLIERPIVVK